MPWDEAIGQVITKKFTAPGTSVTIDDEILVPARGRVLSLRAHGHAALSASSQAVVTVYLNGVATPLLVTLDPTHQKAELKHPVLLKHNDVISLHLVTNGVSTGTDIYAGIVVGD